MRLLASCLTLMIVACTPVPPQGWSGYAEGDYIYMAAPIGGSLEQLAVQPGDQVRAGAALFVLEDEAERAAEAQAGAQLEAARAQAANIQTGRRPEEIAMIRSQLAQVPSLARLRELLDQLDLDLPYPGEGAEGTRGRAGHPKKTHVPDGWLDNRVMSDAHREMIKAAELDISGG